MSAPRYDVTLRRVAPSARFETNGSPADLVAALGAAGLTLPEHHNTSRHADGGVRIDWLGPRRCVIGAPLAQEAVVSRALETAFAEFAGTDVVCVTNAVVSFELTGSGAADVLAQGTPLDLGPAAFPAAGVSGTELWGIGVIVERIAGDVRGFRVIVERSYAGYVEGWLRTAAGMASDIAPGVMRSPAGPA